MTLTFFVPGLPISQGSKRAFVVRTKDGRHRPVLAESAKGLKPWRATVTLAARQAMDADGCKGWHDKQPVRIHLIFTLPRPKSLSRRQMYPVVRPDIDKLARGVLDALKSVVYGDDAQIVRLAAQKQYAEANPGPGTGWPGVSVRVTECVL